MSDAECCNTSAQVHTYVGLVEKSAILTYFSQTFQFQYSSKSPTNVVEECYMDQKIRIDPYFAAHVD